MKCSHRREDCGIVIRFDGELGHHEAAQCVEYLEKTMILYATEPIYLDLSGLTFMDSSGIAVVLGAQRSILGAGQSFTVVGTPPAAMRVFQASGMVRRIPFLSELPRLPEREQEEEPCTAQSTR
ncbi:MAG TPA: anti-sigma factor antagonist [Candidatus Butyricicoccus stercorigallinarum]|nr:anti-sigma factor antagonist [Candidatus Butyricicoccus stercorigallinarum]